MATQRKGARHGDEGLPILEGGFQTHAVAGIQGQPWIAQIQHTLKTGQQIIEIVQRRPPQVIGSHATSICTKALNKVTLELTLCAATEDP